MIRPFLILSAILFATQIGARAGAAETAPLSASLLDNDVLRLRVAHLTASFGQEFIAAQPTNKLDGIILDLRAADGDKNAVAAASGFFAAKKIPLVILVNGQTRGAARKSRPKFTVKCSTRNRSTLFSNSEADNGAASPAPARAPICEANKIAERIKNRRIMRRQIAPCTRESKVACACACRAATELDAQLACLIKTSRIKTWWMKS